MESSFVGLRLTLVAVIAGILGACASVPAPPVGFTVKQVERLESEGFVERDGEYLLGIANRVLFAFDSSDLLPEVEQMLSRLGGSLAEVGIGGARIVGHTDSVGEEAYNAALSERRAASVKSQLVVGGLSDPRMRLVGAGENDPIASNSTEQGRQQNRRVVIIVSPQDALPVSSLSAR